MRSHPHECPVADYPRRARSTENETSIYLARGAPQKGRDRLRPRLCACARSSASKPSQLARSSSRRYRPTTSRSIVAQVVHVSDKKHWACAVRALWHDQRPERTKNNTRWKTGRLPPSHKRTHEIQPLQTRLPWHHTMLKTSTQVMSIDSTRQPNHGLTRKRSSEDFGTSPLPQFAHTQRHQPQLRKPIPFAKTSFVAKRRRWAHTNLRRDNWDTKNRTRRSKVLQQSLKHRSCVVFPGKHIYLPIPELAATAVTLLPSFLPYPPRRHTRANHKIWNMNMNTKMISTPGKIGPRPPSGRHVSGGGM